MDLWNSAAAAKWPCVWQPTNSYYGGAKFPDRPMCRTRIITPLPPADPDPEEKDTLSELPQSTNEEESDETDGEEERQANNQHGKKTSGKSKSKTGKGGKRGKSGQFCKGNETAASPASTPPVRGKGTFIPYPPYFVIEPPPELDEQAKRRREMVKKLCRCANLQTLREASRDRRYLQRMSSDPLATPLPTTPAAAQTRPQPRMPSAKRRSATPVSSTSATTILNLDEAPATRPPAEEPLNDGTTLPPITSSARREEILTWYRPNPQPNVEIHHMKPEFSQERPASSRIRPLTVDTNSVDRLPKALARWHRSISQGLNQLPGREISREFTFTQSRKEERKAKNRRGGTTARVAHHEDGASLLL